MSFSYLAEKVRSADPTDYPFRHVQINDFFSDEDFAALTSAPEIDITGQRSDEHLFETLFASGYKIIDFPGCIVDKEQYLKWHRNKGVVKDVTNSACEGFGITLRLIDPKTAIVKKLIEYLKSDEFLDAIADKFGISRDATLSDNGLQKYLDGYEISPHPDIRKKALTYMVNLNPGADAEARDHHTHYLQLRKEYKFIETFWDGNPDQDRCWVPWDWCETKKMQRENNSIVIFSPNNQTVHAVKANYNHLENQRTQLYGNLWYQEAVSAGAPQWEDFAITQKKAVAQKFNLKGLVKGLAPAPMVDLLRSFKTQDDTVIRDRLNAGK